MSNISGEVEFPLKLVDEEGEIEMYYDIPDLQMNLEDYFSDTDTGFQLTDAKGRKVFLQMSLMDIIVLKLDTNEP